MLNPVRGAFPLRIGLAFICAGVLTASMSWEQSQVPTNDPVSTNTCVGKWQDSDASDVCDPIGTPRGRKRRILPCHRDLHGGRREYPRQMGGVATE